MNVGFKDNIKDGVIFLTIPSFEKTGLVRHCFSTRYGGVSTGIYSSMNLGMSRGDNIDAVKENYRRICTAVGIDISSLVLTTQIHGDNIITVIREDAGKGFERDGFDDADGLITNCSNVTMTAFFADCVPIFFLDPKKRAAGIVHAGWKGTALKIAAKAVVKMTAEFGSNPCDILVGIGPSIGLCHYEVDEPVYNAVYDACKNKSCAKKIKNKYMLDLKKANSLILLNAGVSENNITIADECTFCFNEKYFSHRYSKGKRGNLAAFISLI